jgi:two-component system, OmpR family, sensor histidine kinase BaeS
VTRAVRLVPRGLGARLALAFAAVAIGTAVAVAIAAPPIVGRGFAAMQAAQASGAPSPGSGPGPGHGMGAGAGQGPGAGLGLGQGAYLAQAQQETTTTIIVVAVLAAAVASGLGVLMARRIAKPLEQLEEAAGAVARGDLAARSGLSVRADEIGSLGRSFDAMAADLERNDASRRRFFQDAAHEMKTPLAVIEATAAAVMDGVYEHDDRHLETIRSQARLLGRVVDDLRTISLAEAGALPLRLESVPLGEVLSSIGAAFAARADAAGVSLSTGLPAELPLVVTADRERLGQAMAALVDNAIRFAPSGGRVFLQASLSPRSSSLARVEVLDDGPGVPAEDLAHVFDRFYQVDPSRDRGSGTSGLGLAITRAIVEAHGGSTGVENPAGGGARFWIDLPLASQA